MTLPTPHHDLIAALRGKLAADAVITDDLRRLAYGTDASFYRLVPEVIAVVNDEDEVRHVVASARAHGRPVTFRAAGTSLSGQAITDGVLVLIGDGFATCDINADASMVRAGPGMVGGDVNRRLAPFGRKIGPDPASINACKIGGIAANNASGMCCGTAQNSYRTVAGMRLVLADGSVLDTEDAQSVAAFKLSHAELLTQLGQLAWRTRANRSLAERIARKYKIKNTTGYSLNALIDFDEPLDILTHLMIGSEGTLGFISRISYHTVPEHKHKASALVFFHDIRSACEAVIRLKPQPVAAVELLDRPALRSVQDKPGLPDVIRTLGDEASALLIEVRAEDATQLQAHIAAALGAIDGIATVEAASFSTDPAQCEMYWNVRKGTFPSVGAMREIGTTVIIEDVAFPVEAMAAATLDLQALLKKHGYHEAIIFGHALEGNLHFVFTQDFGNQTEIDRYSRFMDEVCALVVGKYDGSLKAEHGTGRNMAPYVELEWGQDALRLMRDIKELFDPEQRLNPGVILNNDPHAHLKNLKPMPAAEDLVDRCIECGFCEPQCPSHRLTLSPRQRIVGWRELARRQAAGEAPGQLGDDYVYQGMDTCAGCGLCSTACPVYIDTGELIRRLRGRRQSSTGRLLGQFTADHFGTVAAVSRTAVKAGHLAAGLLGEGLVNKLSGGAWRHAMPPAAAKLPAPAKPGSGDPVVYFPTCGGRIFGAAGEDSLPTVVMRVLQRAGYAPRLPADYDSLCCGQMLASKGQEREADALAERLEAALFAVSDNGRLPVILDASPCALRMKERLKGKLEVYDLAEFAHDALLPRLRLHKQSAPLALHVNCSARRAGLEAKLKKLAEACAEQVVVPLDVKCCGFGGDRGFAAPELNVHALRHIHRDLPAGCSEGVSSNRTCELGLTAETGVNYRSIVYLLDECSQEEEQMTC
jgi:D-lactate dehydrogenase